MTIQDKTTSLLSNINKNSSSNSNNNPSKDEITPSPLMPHQLFHGFNLCIHGLIHIFQVPKIYKRIYWLSLLLLMFTFTSHIFTSVFIVLPLKLLSKLISILPLSSFYFCSFVKSGSIHNHEDDGMQFPVLIYGYFMNFFIATPEFILIFIRNCYPEPLDYLFFESLRDYQAKNSEKDDGSNTAAIKNEIQKGKVNKESKESSQAVSSQLSTSNHVKKSNHSKISRIAEILNHSWHLCSFCRRPRRLCSNEKSQSSSSNSFASKLWKQFKRFTGIGHDQYSLSFQLDQRRIHPSKRLFMYLKRYIKTLPTRIGFWILLKIPFIGFVVSPIAYLVYLKKLFSEKVAFFLLFMYVVSPPFRQLKMINEVIGFRMFMRELVDPYLCRVLMNPQQKHDWFKKNQWSLIGFSFLFYLLIHLPLIGPLSFMLAQGALARWIADTQI